VTVTESSRTYAAERVAFVWPERSAEGVCIMAKMSAERASSDGNSAPFQVAAVCVIAISRKTVKGRWGYAP
jgi:hypothetical protein